MVTNFYIFFGAKLRKISLKHTILQKKHYVDYAILHVFANLTALFYKFRQIS